MMSSGVYVALYSAILFFVLTPNVLLRLPPKGSTMMVAFVHALVFGIVFYFAHALIMKMAGGYKEGATNQNGCGAGKDQGSNCTKQRGKGG